MARGKYTVNEVEERSKVPGSTLRQWERRYGFPKPERSEAGYRLYSDDDLNHIETMKRHIAEGIPASRAAELVQRLSGRPRGPRSTTEMRRELAEALLDLDELRADAILSEAHALHTVEAVVLELLQGSIEELGGFWDAGTVNAATKHFASAYIQGRLHVLLRLSPNLDNAPVVVVACAPSEQDELGALVLALFLRRSGYRVTYLGANVPVKDLYELARRLDPAGVMISASGTDALQALAAERGLLERLAPLVGFGGRAFAGRPEQARALGGIYLGRDVQRAVERFRALLLQRVTRA